MAIVIHIVDGSQDPNKQQQETHAGLILSRDPELGWRSKLTAMPTQREILRCVSDCPLAIAENVLLWSKRWGWKIKLHPNSVSLKQLMKEVKSYTPSGNPEVVILAAAMLLKNFAPPEMQKQQGLPDFSGLLQRLQAQQSRPQPQAQPAQPVQPVQQPVQQPRPAQQQQPLSKDLTPNSPGTFDSSVLNEPRESIPIPVEQPRKQWVGDGASKMMRTQERYEQHMQTVNATVAANERKRQVGEAVAADLEKELAEIDDLLNDDAEEQEIVIETPEFKSKKEAIQWSLEVGAFENGTEAGEFYDELKKEVKIKALKDFSPIWAQNIQTLIA